MTEYIFLGVILVLCALLYFQHKTFAAQISEMTKALIAKTAQEFSDLKRADKPAKPQKEDLPDLGLNDLSDKKFLELIGKQNE